MTRPLAGSIAPRRRPAEAGFTLVELMVAVTGGLFVSVVVFALASQGSRFYQRESRVADATLSVIAGFERLQSDIARAGFMASPNIRQDPSLCQSLPASGNALLPGLAALRVTRPDATGDPAQNGIEPDQLLLSGNYTSSDHFPIEGVNAATLRVALQPNIGPLARAGYPGMTADDRDAYLNAMFPAGRAVRIVDAQGRTQYSVISGVDAGAAPQIVLDPAVTLTFRGGNSSLCGLTGGVETNAVINVVNFIRYELANLSDDASYAAIYGDPNPFDAGRVDLVRSELDPHDGTVIGGTQEIVAEYAVDFQVGLTAVQTRVGQDVTALATIAPGDAAVLAWAGDSLLNPVQGPHLVRAVRVRLSVRSREPDRDAPIVAGGAVAPGLYRVGLGDNGSAPFARVRTLQTDVMLDNLAEVAW